MAESEYRVGTQNCFSSKQPLTVSSIFFPSLETSGFVTKTMAALKSESYLPSSLRSQQAGSSRPEASTSSKKRSADDEGRHSPAKIHREEVDDSERLARGPSSSRNDGRSEGRRDRHTKPPCRDFHLRGFCPRGDECRYDHTIPNPEFTMNPLMNMQGMQGQGGQQFPMQGIPNQQQQNPMFMMPHQGSFPIGMQGSPGPWSANGNGISPQQPGLFNGAPGNGSEGAIDLGSRLGPQQQGSEMSTTSGAHEGGGFRGGGRGGGLMGRGGIRGTFEKRHTSNTTLVIENVPVENLDLIKINEYFKKFGTITNIQIDVDSKKALVSYSQPSEAKTAHTSPEVIFNNRFVKVYFQKLDDPGIGVKSKEPSAPTVPPLKNNFIPGQTSNKFVRADLAQSKTKEAQEAARSKLDTLMAEQKDIMTKLTTSTTPAEEKKSLMTRFGALEGEIKAATEEVRLSVSSVNQSKEASPVTNSEGASNWKNQRESKQKEQLDRELEAHSQGGTGSTTEELKAHLAKLQEEAAKLGIDAEAAAGRGGFRGRARGGAAFRGATSRGFSTYNARGRGGAVNRASMSIDNRPTKLQVSELPEQSQDKVKEYFKQFGEFNNIEDKEDGNFTIHYKTRLSGERALRSGLDIPEVGQVKATWAIENVNRGENDSVNTSEAVEEEAGDEEEGDRDDHFRRR